MKLCPYCGYANYDEADECRKCQSPFVGPQTTAVSSRQKSVGPEKARHFRKQALSFLVIGLLIKVYWGGYGPWTAIDNPTLAGVRGWLEPLFIYGGLSAYLLGWVLKWI